MPSRKEACFDDHPAVEKGAVGDVLGLSENASSWPDYQTPSSNKHKKKHAADKRALSTQSSRTTSKKSSNTISTQATSIDDLLPEVPTAAGTVNADFLGIGAWTHPLSSGSSTAYQQPDTSKPFVDNVWDPNCSYHGAMLQNIYSGVPSEDGRKLTPVERWINQDVSTEGTVLYHCACIALHDILVLE